MCSVCAKSDPCELMWVNLRNHPFRRGAKVLRGDAPEIMNGPVEIGDGRTIRVAGDDSASSGHVTELARLAEPG